MMIDRTSSDDMVSLASGMQVGAVVVLERDPGGSRPCSRTASGLFRGCAGV